MPQVDKYNYEAPTREFAIGTLIRSLGRDEAQRLWNEACNSNNIEGRANTLEDLERVSDFISEQPGVAGVLGKSLTVRIRTFKTLNH
jgi:hypothetical protein